jgi:hypothetical protein
VPTAVRNAVATREATTDLTRCGRSAILHAVRILRSLSVALVVILWSAVAWSGSPDIERQIQALRGTANDMEALDSERRVREEIGVLRQWLDEAWNFQSRGADGTAKRFLDLCVGQTELIRQRINTVKAGSDADKREAAVADTKNKIQKTREALDKAKTKKSVLEAQTK